jgi:hypothetical protein
MLCFVLSGCKKNDTLESDKVETTTDGAELLLQMQDEKNEQSKELTTEVIRGDFTKSLNAKAYLTYTKSSQITYETKSLTTIFVEYLVKENQVVKKGDAIATIRYEGDPIHLEELKVQLKQLEEKVEIDLSQKKSQIKSLENQIHQTTDKNEKTKLQSQLEAATIDYTSYENQTNESKQLLQTEIKDYKLIGTTDYILAPCDGIAAKPEDIESESALWMGQLILTIYEPESAILAFEDLNSLIRYGMDVSIEVTINKETETLTGKVISGENLISEDRRTGYAYVKVDDFDCTKYLEAKFKVMAMIIDIKDVLLVEEIAVTVEDSKTYITCLENGKREKVYFVSGGLNDTYYWVLEGLEEGMAALR